MSTPISNLPRAARRRVLKRWLKQTQYMLSGFSAPEFYVTPKVRGKSYRTGS